MDQRNGDEMTEFFHMGGYASYVWSSYGIAFISLLLTLILPLRANTAIIKRLKGRFRREQIQEQEASGADQEKPDAEQEKSGLDQENASELMQDTKEKTS